MQNPPPPPPSPDPKTWPAGPPQPFPRFCGNGRHVGAIFLIAAGVALFLNNIGLLPIGDIWRYWPLALIAVGFGKLLNSDNSRHRTSGAITLFFGFLFLGSNFHWYSLRFSDGTWILGILLVFLGIATLAGLLDPSWTLSRQARRERFRREFVDWQRYASAPAAGVNPSAAFTTEGIVRERLIQEEIVFGAVKRRVTSDAFIGGSVQCIFSSVELDLRLASVPTGSAQILMHCVFGSVKIVIPSTWRVSARIAGGFGSVEDKTLPLTRSDAAGPILILTGSNVFGSIEIIN